MAKQWLPIREASVVLEASDRTIRRWITEKKLKGKRINRVMHVLIDDAFVKPQEETTEQETPNNRQAEKDIPEENAKNETVLFTELVRQLEVKDNQIKDLNERLRETGLLLNNAQLRLAPPSTETANGEVIGFDKKSSPEGIVDAKKAKFISDLTNILIIFLLVGLLIAVGVFITQGLRT